MSDQHPTIPVEDITVLFSSGREAMWTLKPDDTCDEQPDIILITIKGEVTLIQRAHVAMIQRRQRQMTVREPKAKGPFNTLEAKPQVTQ